MALDDALPMLEGIRVIDMSSVVFGPYTTQILGDLGAEIIKVETPKGDDFRSASRPAVSKKMAPEFMALNRNKKSIILDLKTDEDASVMRSLLESADIFIHNVRTKAIGRLGFGYDSVRQLNPEIIYTHCLGFGSNGPYKDLQAYDDAIQAAAGVSTLLPRVDGNPAPRFLPSLIADKAAGLHGAYATLAAVIHKLRTGKGQYIEVPLFETFCNFMLKEHLSGHAFEPKVGKVGYGRQLDPNRQPFPTSDGYIVIVPYRWPQWPTVMEILGDTEFMKAPAFQDPSRAKECLKLLYQRTVELTPSRTTAEWEEAFRAANIPAQAVRDLDDILEDPHLQATGFFHRTDHATEGVVYQLSEPSTFSGWEGPAYHDAPLLGQHTDEIRDTVKSSESE